MLTSFFTGWVRGRSSPSGKYKARALSRMSMLMIIFIILLGINFIPGSYVCTKTRIPTLGNPTFIRDGSFGTKIEYRIKTSSTAECNLILPRGMMTKWSTRRLKAPPPMIELGLVLIRFCFNVGVSSFGDTESVNSIWRTRYLVFRIVRLQFLFTKSRINWLILSTINFLDIFIICDCGQKSCENVLLPPGGRAWEYWEREKNDVWILQGTPPTGWENSQPGIRWDSDRRSQPLLSPCFLTLHLYFLVSCTRCQTLTFTGRASKKMGAILDQMFISMKWFATWFEEEMNKTQLLTHGVRFYQFIIVCAAAQGGWPHQRHAYPKPQPSQVPIPENFVDALLLHPTQEQKRLFCYALLLLAAVRGTVAVATTVAFPVFEPLG